MNWLEVYQKLPVAMLIVDLDKSTIEFINTACKKLLVRENNTLVGAHINTLFPDLSLQRHTAKPLLTIDYKVEELLSIKLNIDFIDLDEDKLALYIYPINNDILQEKEDTESRLEAIIDEAVDGIITINNRGIIESMNPAGAKLFGYSQEEVVGNNIKMLMPEPYHSEHDEYIENYQHTGTRKIIGIGREVTAKRKDGSTFPIHLSISEVKLRDRVIYTGILHNLSDRKAAEGKIKRYAIELERSNLELQDFAYVSSHDLQEPLRKIRAFGDRLKSKESNNLSEKGLDYLNRMVNAAERMQILINDLLSFSRVSTHAKRFVQVDLNEIVEGVLSDLEFAVEQSHALIEIEKLPTIEAEPFQMRQLFQNLIGNAIKFRKSGVAPHIKIGVQSVERKNSVAPPDLITKITVKDNGIGFNDQYKDKIFQIFQRLEGRKYDGSGIGLAICKRIISRHGGIIEASGDIDVGATFIVTLPFKQQQQQEVLAI